MSNSGSQTILCQEIFDDSSQPSEKEIIDYAVKIGIDPKTEPHLLPIAKDGLMQALPDAWKPCYDSSLDRYYYYNSESGVSQWEHPLDSKYKDKVRRGRSEGYSSAASLIGTGEDDSKTTAKEDLRSFEEVSDMLSSRSLDSKLMRRNQHPTLLSQRVEEGGGLLARRKQNQRLEGEMAVATAVVTSSANNPTITTTTLLNNTHSGVRGSGGIDEALRLAKQRLTPMRRSQTLEEVLPRRDDVWQEDTWQDELPNASKWISDRPEARSRRQSEVIQKRPVGILRDSPSDPNPPPRRLAPIQGPFGWNEGEDERKRSVRFADLERKSLDIKFDVSGAATSQSSASNSEEEPAIETDSSDGENNERKSSDGKGRLWESKSSVDSEKTVESSNSGSGEKTRRGMDSAKSMETSSDSVHKKSTETSSESVRPLEKSTESSTDSKASSCSYSKLKDGGRPTVVAPEPEVKERLIKREVSFDDTVMTKIEVEHRKMTADQIAVLEKQLAQQLQQKIAALNEEMNSTLLSAKVSIRKKETNEILKIRSEYEKKIKEFKESLEEEMKEKQNSLRLEMEAEIEEFLSKLEEEKNTKLLSARDEMEEEIERVKESYKESLSAQSENNQTLIDQTRKNSDLRLNEEVKSIKAREEAEISRLEAECDEAVQQAKLKFSNRIKELELSHEKEIEKLLEEQSKTLERLKLEKEGEWRRVEAEWQDRVTATASQHKDMLESAVAQHDARLHQLRSHFTKQEEELKKKHAEQLEAWNLRVQKMADKDQSHLSHINREFEKMRCEKRLLEDKYRSLKDKYIQMKTEMRMAIERRMQKKKKLQSSQNDSGKVEINIEGCSYDKSVEKQGSRHHQCESNNNACYLELPQNDDAQLSSADELLTSTSVTYPSHSRSQRKEEDLCRGGCKASPRSPLSGHRSPVACPKSPLLSANTPIAAPKSPLLGLAKSPLETPKSPVGGAAIILDNLKSQLVEFDYLGEPSTALPDTYLRYPFAGAEGRSAEVDFYRHRLVVEEEAVKQARQCLEQQAKELEARHALLANQPSSTLHQLQQQERDLTEMEVSLHRTKALLGEKMIRLRLLGHTLASLNPQGGGGDEQNNWKTYDNINAEIQEIWAALDKVTSLSTAKPSTQFDFSKLTKVGEWRRREDESGPGRGRFVTPASPALAEPNRNRAQVEAKLESIKDWLQVTSKRASLSL